MVMIGLLAILPFFVWEVTSRRVVELNTATLATFAYVGVFPSVVAYLFFNYGVARLGRARGDVHPPDAGVWRAIVHGVSGRNPGLVSPGRHQRDFSGAVAVHARAVNGCDTLSTMATDYGKVG